MYSARQVKGSEVLTKERRPGEEAEQGWLDSELLMESWWLSGGPGVCSAHMIFKKNVFCEFVVNIEKLWNTA